VKSLEKDMGRFEDALYSQESDVEATDSEISILVADDSPDSLLIFNKILSTMGFSIRLANDGLSALDSIKNNPPSLILLDIEMPKLNGYELCKIIKEDKKLKDIPVIFISGNDEEAFLVKAFELGAVDYLKKPIRLDETRSRVKTHLKIKMQQDQLITLHKDLLSRQKELESFNEAMLGREMRILELKKEVNSLSRKLNTPPPYTVDWDDGDMN
jgi:PleD family two-component response regulator